jgi:hypothetical protein
MQAAIPFFDFKAELERLRQALALSDFNAIQHGLLIQKSKTLLMKKVGLVKDLEVHIGRVAEEQDRLKTNFLILCRENGITQQDLEEALESSKPTNTPKP